MNEQFIQSEGRADLPQAHEIARYRRQVDAFLAMGIATAAAAE